MEKYIMKQLLLIIPTVLIVSIVAFSMLRLLPTDAVDVYLTANHLQYTEENIQAVRTEMGLDKPVIKQYLLWMDKVVHLNFGNSYMLPQKTVGEMLWPSFLATLELALAAVVWIVLLTPLLGIPAARGPNGTMDEFSRVFCMFGTAVPAFVLGFFLIRLFGVDWKLVPVSGRECAASMLLPSFTLSMSHVAYFVRMLRTEMLENANKPYVLYASARGIGQRQILNTHVLKNALMPIINTFGFSFGRLIAGSVVVENVFSWPGLGKLITWAILARDFPVIQAYVLLVAVVFIIANLLSDILSAIANPRIRLGANG